MTNAIVQLNAIEKALAEAKTIEDVVEIRNAAEALRFCVKKAGHGLEMQNQAAAMKIEVERKAGEILSINPKNPGAQGRIQEHLSGDDTVSSPDNIPTYAEQGITTKQASRWQKEFSVPEQIYQQWKAETLANGEELTSAGLLRLARKNVHFSSKTPEHYTPPHIIALVLDVLGEIDLDPCSDNHDNPTVPAKHHFAKGDGGLEKEWFGRVYMNPPYGNEIGEWVSHLHNQHTARNVPEAIALVPSRTDTRWFRVFKDYLRCFIWGRLHFSDNSVGAPFPSMATYLGDRKDRFAEVFSTVGDIYATFQWRTDDI